MCCTHSVTFLKTLEPVCLYLAWFHSEEEFTVNHTATWTSISGMALSLMAVEWTGRWFLLLQRRRRHVIDILEQNVDRLHHDGGNLSKKRVQLQSCVEQRVTACCVPIDWCVVSDHSSSHIKLLTQSQPICGWRSVKTAISQSNRKPQLWSHDQKYHHAGHL